MKSSHIVIAVLCIAGCMMNGCTKDKLPTEPSIPDQAPTGAGVLVANIDGSPWAAEDIAGDPTGTSTYSGNILHISGARSVVGDTAEAEGIDLTIEPSASKAGLSLGTYTLGTIPAQEGEAEQSVGTTSVCRTTSGHSGTVTITALDTVRKVVSGRFAFNGIGVDGQTHVINEGMFDVTWK
jgi:hypothetical protein